MSNGNKQYVCASAITKDSLEREMNRLHDLGYRYMAQTVLPMDNGSNMGLVIMQLCEFAGKGEEV